MPIYTLFSFKESTLKHWKHFFGESKQTHSTPHEGFIFVEAEAFFLTNRLMKKSKLMRRFGEYTK